MKIQGFPFPEQAIKGCEYLPANTEIVSKTAAAERPGRDPVAFILTGPPKPEGFKVVLHRHAADDPPLITRIPQEVAALMEWLEMNPDKLTLPGPVPGNQSCIHGKVQSLN